MSDSLRSLVFICISITLFACSGGGSEGPGGGDTNETSIQSTGTLSLNTIGDKNILATESLNFSLSASNPNSNNVTYTTDGNVGTGGNVYMLNANFDEITGQFSWASAIEGNYLVQFTATNDAVPPESDSTSLTINVLGQVAYGLNLYNQFCQSCHGAGGSGGSATQVKASSPLEVREALGIEPGFSPRPNMGGIANQLEDQIRDANAIGYYLCDAGGLDINDTSVCLP